MSSKTIRVRLLGSHTPTSQRVEHRYFYRIAGLEDVTQEDLLPFAETFRQELVLSMVNVMGNSIRYTAAEVRQDSGGLVAFYTFPTPLIGGITEETELPFYCMKLKLNRSRTNVRSSNKFLSGVVGTLFGQSGEITSVPLQDAMDILQFVTSNPLVDSLVNTWNPVLMNKYVESTGTFMATSFIGSATYDGLTTQRSRKRKAVLG